MSRMLSLSAVAALCLLGTALAQRPTSQAGRARVAAPAVDANLKRILTAWYDATRGVKKLQGRHEKYVYNTVFSLETRAVGQFYYESPDKGRIDIFPAKIPRGAVSERIGRNKRPFALKSASAEQWISTGKEIYQIDPVKKKGTKFPIPKSAQGRNIMDGPLPFLLGMPPAKALQRYHLKILSENKAYVTLEVYPKWQKDRANYVKANVILQKTNHYLPYAVQLHAPKGFEQTVYVFGKETKVNPLNLLGVVGRGWFEGPLRGVKITTAVPKGPRRPIKVVRQPNQLPNLMGHKWDDAKKWLEQQKLKVRFIKGSIAADPQALRVESQFPQPFTPFRPGQTVYIEVQVPPKMHKAADYAAVPDIGGQPYTVAEKALKARGFKVELRKGSVAPAADKEYCVQYQYPFPQRKTVKGEKILLVLYVKSSDLKPQKRMAAKPR